VPPKFRGPTGWVGIVAQEQSRYTDFWRSMLGLEVPPGWETRIIYGYDTIYSRNKMVKEFLESKADWLMFMDDDHLVPKDLIRHLLAHEKDVVAPLCLRRYPDFWPTAHIDGLPLRWEGQRELIEVDSTGCPGMLVHRKVFEATRLEYRMQERDKQGRWLDSEQTVPYWFRHGGKHPDRMAEDTDWCDRVREVGFTVWLDTEAWLGHYTTACVMPGNDGQILFAFGPKLEYLIGGPFRYSQGGPTTQFPGVLREVS
jgi:hypothetical protein